MSVPESWDILTSVNITQSEPRSSLECRRKCDFKPHCLALTYRQGNCTLYTSGDQLSSMEVGEQTIHIKICGKMANNNFVIVCFLTLKTRENK